MKKYSLALTVLLGSLLFSLSYAQTPGRGLDSLYSGYTPTVMNSQADVDQLFNDMPMGFKTEGFLRSGSQCFHRAQIWTYDMVRNRGITPMKVFVFYTFAYKKAYLAQFGHKFIWWFHVAPYVLTHDQYGSLKESVVDPTFADTALDMGPWSQLFVETHKPCKEWVRYQDFKNEVVEGPNAYVGTEHCYLVRVPATDFDPPAVEARDLGQTGGYQWNLADVKIAVEQACVNSTRDSFMARLGL
jgi:hypothetical protein